MNGLPGVYPPGIFQFTPLREGRLPLARARATRRCIFQFTPLREGRPELEAAIRQQEKISIHAPPRGATQKTCEKS